MLQLQVSYVSKDDRSFVVSAMDSGMLFRNVTEIGACNRIMNKLLSVDVLIPGLDTFLENMKYIAIGAKVPIQDAPREAAITEEQSREEDHDLVPEVLINMGYKMPISDRN